MRIRRTRYDDFLCRAWHRHPARRRRPGAAEGGCPWRHPAAAIFQRVVDCRSRVLFRRRAVLHVRAAAHPGLGGLPERLAVLRAGGVRSEEHTSELQSLMRISYAVFCLKKKTKKVWYTRTHTIG